MSLPALSIRRPIMVLTLLASILVLGLIALYKLPVGFLPDFEQPMLFVRVPYPNSTPDQVERTIVRPLEESLASVKGLRSMWSGCDADGGTVQVRFDWSRDMDLARV